MPWGSTVPLFVDVVVVVRSRSGHNDIGVHGRVIVLVAALVEPGHGTILRPLEAAHDSIDVHRRVVDVQPNSATQQ